MQILDPLDIPLQGRRLIEASAGTGKTYSIVLFYLRLLLEQQLGVDRILVVTFTTAATEELRHRIRTRLREALDILEGRANGDPLLAALLEKSAGDPARAARLLADALTCMDEAAIHTIHGFCQRMLQDHAFESGVPFAIEFLESEGPLRRQIIEDFWRRRFYDVPAAEAAWAEATWHDPAGLLKALEGPLLNRTAEPAVRIDTHALAGLRHRVERLLEQVRERWPAAREPVRRILEEDPCLRRAKNNYRPDRVAAILAAMDRFAAENGMVWELPGGLPLLARSVMALHLKRNCRPADHPFFDLFDDLYSSLERLLADSRVDVLLAAREFLLAELDRRKAEQEKMYFDDLLLRLRQVLSRPDHGDRLAEQIRNRFPAALVDEFQDTDPIQYRIFATIYPPDQGGCLLMIGDPKQAIYSFRGADIFTYIRARRDTPAGACYTMATNHRSSKAMVQAVNRLFAAPASFVFADDIPFAPVNVSSRTPVPLLLDGEEPLPLQCLYLAPELAARPGKPIARDRALDASAGICAGEIARLLARAGKGRALLGDRSLRAADIAILVRTHREADRMRQALAGQGISSVYSSRQSVFSSQEALEMQRLLAVMVRPADEALVRGLLAGELIGCNGNDLERLQEDELAMETLLAGLRDARQVLTTQGFLPMFQTLLVGHGLVRRLSAQPAGERKLTNYLHLAELLQQAWEGATGPDGLLRWLNQQINDPDQDADSQQLRLESDENLVRIVTIHKAKGLEYPVVFLPCPWSGRTVDGTRPFAFHRPHDLQLMADPGSDDPGNLQRAAEELLAEELRIFYVAVTRARNCCYFCWGRVSGMENAAPAWLLHRHGGNSIDVTGDQNLQEDLLALNSTGPLIELLHRQEEAPPATGQASVQAPEPQPRRFTGRIDTGWRISSYSQLAADHESGTGRIPAEETVLSTRPSPFTFPRGAAAGTCLHAILEELEFSSRPGNLEQVTQHHLARAGMDPDWLPVVCSWMDNILDTDLGGGMRLRLLADSDRRPELEFHFSLADLDLDRFNRVTARFGIRPVPRERGPLRGLMKGFIDLVFRYRGRYYLADYKSNYLGASAADYAPERLGAAMVEHHYDLQCVIYTLALHRFLKRRISNYTYDRSFGGALYLFLRGMHPDHPPGTGIWQVRPPLALIHALDLCCRGEK